MDAALISVPQLLEDLQRGVHGDEQVGRIDVSYAAVPRIACLTLLLPALGPDGGAEFAAAFTDEQFCAMAYEALLSVTVATNAGLLSDSESEVCVRVCVCACVRTHVSVPLLALLI